MQNKSVVNPLGLDELVFKISLNGKDPLRKSVPDKEQASAIQEANKMADGTVSVSIKIVDDSSVDVYRDPLKKLQKFYYENTLPIGKGKQPHRIVSTMNLNKFKKEFDQLILDVQDGMKKFKRSYKDQESWHARCQARLGSKYDKGNYPSVDDVEKNLNIHHSMDAFGDFSKSGGAFLDPETLSTLKKQQKESMDAVETYATQHVWERILEPLQKMHDTLKVPIEDSKKFHGTLVTNLVDVANALPGLNFRGNGELEEIRKDLMDLTSSIESVDDLKTDPAVREEAVEGAKKVLSKMGGYGMKRQPA